nr:MAG TPA: hypothetical protein [Caudoviricetes sp.]
MPFSKLFYIENSKKLMIWFIFRARCNVSMYQYE